MSHRIFISHARLDAELARALHELLRLGADVSSQEIFCSSVDGTGIPLGRDFAAHIREQMTDAALVVQLITPAYMESAFCLCELGAQWALAREGFPIVVPPASGANVQAVLRSVQVGRIDHGPDLDKLFETVCRRFERDRDVVTWNAQRERFLAELPRRLRALAPARAVDAVTYKRTLVALQEQQTLVTQLQGRVDELEGKLAKLAAAKSAEEVAAALASKDEWTELYRLAELLRQELGSLPHCVRDVLMAHAAGLWYEPESENEEPDITAALKDGFLHNEGDEWNAQLTLNDDDPNVGRALQAYERLGAFIGRSPDLRRAFAAKHDMALELGNRRVWSELEI